MTDLKLQTMVAARKAEVMALQEPPLDLTVKRPLVPRRFKTGMLYEIVYEGGGSVPEQLSGAYTGTKQAIEAINSYIREKEHIADNKRPLHKRREHAYKNKIRS